jgi:hypothetical protein
MIKELMMKWFGLEPEQCKTCEVLRVELDYARRQNEILLGRLLSTPVREETPPVKEESIQAVGPSGGRRFIPHAVQQQMAAKEDAKSLELMIQKRKEMEAVKLAQLEKEVGVEDASKVS